MDVFQYSTTQEGTAIYGATITLLKDNNGNPKSGTIPAGAAVYNWKHLEFEYIGGVVAVTGSTGPLPISGSTVWTLYEIQQGDCIYEITIGGGTGGGSTVTWEYDGPFKVIGGKSVEIQGTTVNSVQITGIDTDAQNRTKAGLVCYTGTNCGLVDPGVATGITTGSDIFACITADGISYRVGVDPADNPPAYNVRLAKVIDNTTYYTVTFPEGVEIKDESPMAGSTISSIYDAMTTGGGIIPDPSDTTGSHFSIGVGETGQIYEVQDNVCTDRYIVGGTASVTAWSESTIKQIHYGDIYVDGRWL